MAIDINTAEVSELAAIEELGQERAQLIVEYRDEIGSFDSLEELKDLPGFSEDTVEMLRDRGVVVGSPAGSGEELM